MQLKNKNILLISPEPWDHIFVSKHHYATHLGARGNKVFFLNPPQNKTSIEPTDFNNVQLVNYRGFIKGIRFFPSFIQKWLMHKKFNQLQQLCNTTFDIVWSFDNSVFFNFNALPKSILKISHIVDLNQNFQFAQAAVTANMCLGTTQSIVSFLKKNNPNTHFVTHGYNAPSSLNEEIILPGNNQIRALYAGNLDISYLDWESIEIIIINNPTIDFLFAGKMKIIKAIFSYKNVFHLGIITSNQLPYYYQKADVLWICYKANEFEEQLANPHKMMEYLGSGKVVIATKTQEYKILGDESLIAMSDKNEEFPELFKSVIQDLKTWNTEEKCKKRMQYALDNTYNKQIDKIERIIQKKQI